MIGKPRLRYGRVLAAAGVTVLATTAAAPAPTLEDPRITSSTQVSEDDLAPARTYSSPFVLVHPDDPNIAVAAAVEMRSRICHLFRSADAGRNWTLMDALPSTEEFPFCFHTSGTGTQTPMAWGSDGTLYYGLTGWGAGEDVGTGSEHGGISGNLSVLLARSDNLGESYETVPVRDTRAFRGAEIENNRPVSAVAVDTTGDEDVVYVGWRRNLPEVEDAPSVPQVAASTDGGRTFGEPVNPRGPEDQDGGGAPTLAVADDGTLYALFSASSPGDEPSSLRIARSTDQGATFETFEASPPSSYYADEILAWSPEGGAQGTLHIVYENKIDPAPGAGERDIYHRRSTDGGETWSEGVIVNDDDPEQFYVQVTPNVNVAPNGRVDVAWWDFRDDPGLFVNDVYYSYSTDNGSSWSPNMRISDESSDRKIGTWSNGFDMRAPVGIGSTNAFTLLGWDDTRLGDETTQTQDIYAGNVQFRPIEEGTSNTVRYAIAALAGLAITGLVLLVASPILGLKRKKT